MRRHAKAVFVLAMLCSFFALAATPSFASFVEPGSVFATDPSNFGAPGNPKGSGSADGFLFNPGQADVNDSSGKLYVADTGNNRVQVFTLGPNGEELDSQLAIAGPTGIAVDQGSGSVYVANAAGVSKLNADLTPAVGWSAPAVTGALAVDPSSGDLLLADTDANLVRRFESDGTPAGSFAAERPLDLAVDVGGAIIAVTSTGNVTGECGPSSALVRFSDSGSNEGLVNAALRTPGAVALGPNGSLVVATNVNQYFCEDLSDLNPHVVALDPSGQVAQDMTLPNNYAAVPGLAVRRGPSPRLYAVTKSPLNDQYGGTEITAFRNLSPPQATIDAVDPAAVTATAATFEGAVNPEGRAAEWSFEYSRDGGATWASTPKADAGEGTAPVDVEASVTGLDPNVAYQVRLQATSSDGVSVAGPVIFHTDASKPLVETLTVTNVAAGEAWPRAAINPAGSATSYFFEYGTSTAYGARVPLGREGSAGNGTSDVTVEEALHDLQPSTTYHYRVIASNGLGTTTGEDRSFTTSGLPVTCANEALRQLLSATFLPDCRAYEQVSPVEKFGYDVSSGNRGIGVNLTVSPSGEALAYDSFYALSETANAGSLGAWKAQRSGGGWSTNGTLPTPGSHQFILTFTPQDAVLRGVTPDGRTAVYFDNTNRGGAGLWIARADGSRQLIATGSNSDRNTGASEFGAGPGQPWFEGISDDGRHVVFADSDALVAGLAPTGKDFLYEWVDDGADGKVRLVSRTNDLAPTPLGTGAAELGGSASNRETTTGGSSGARNAISANGERIFFQAPAPVADYQGAPNASLAERTGGPLYMRSGGARTVEVSAPEPGHLPAEHVLYLDASKAGSIVYFWADGQLTDGADGNGGIYRYDVDAAALTFVSSATPSADLPPTAMASDDGSRLYFQSGGSDLYLHQGGGTRLIAEDATVVAGERSGNVGVYRRPGLRDDRCPSANVTPDGRFFAFSAVAPSGVVGVYRYDAVSRSLVQLTAGAAIDSTFRSSCTGGAFYPPVFRARVMSDDGRFVFFDAASPLVARDADEGWDAYGWHEGHLSLISPGDDGTPSSFQGTDASGANAFFTTASPLVPQDIDRLNDLYDARVGGGFEPPPPPPQCEGEACQGSVLGVSPQPRAISSTVRGPGNASARKHKQRKHTKRKKARAKHRKHSAQQRKGQRRNGHRNNPTNGNRRAGL